MLLPDDIEPPPFTDDDLEAYFAFEEETARLIAESETAQPVGHREPFPSVVAAWSVCDTGSAEYAMRKLAHAEAAEDEIAVQEAAFMAQIKRWADGQSLPHKRAINFFTGQLESYARRKREEEGQKTLRLPSGEVTSRLNPARPEVPKDGEPAFIEWARTTPMVKAKWSPVMAEVKKRVSFEVVRVPDYGGEHLTLVHWPSSDGESMWVAVPDGTQGPQGSAMAAEDLPNFHDEVWPICEGFRVPGVVQVPEEVTYTIKPARP